MTGCPRDGDDIFLQQSVIDPDERPCDGDLISNVVFGDVVDMAAGIKFNDENPRRSFEIDGDEKMVDIGRGGKYALGQRSHGATIRFR